MTKVIKTDNSLFLSLPENPITSPEVREVSEIPQTTQRTKITGVTSGRFKVTGKSLLGLAKMRF